MKLSSLGTANQISIKTLFHFSVGFAVSAGAFTAELSPHHSIDSFHQE